MTTLIRALELSARHSDERGICIFDRRGQHAERRTYPQILDAAKDRAARLAGAGVQPQDRILVCLPTSWDLLELYLGAIFRGAHPVLVAPPGALGGAAAHAQKIANLIELLTPRRVICDDSTRRELREFGQAAAADASLTCAELFAVASAAGDSIFPARETDLAFMQLTSGSTGRQRAVMIPHSALMHNTRAMATFSQSEIYGSGVVVSWLPLNHDMGLVGCLMFAATHGLNLHLLRPETFLARPLAWLRTLSERGGNMSAAPNFAYHLCNERIEAADVAGLNLSSWSSAVTGAEMIRPETFGQFCERFRAAQFRPGQVQPCYGMAEATLAATACERGNGVRSVPMPSGSSSELKDVVSCGRPVIDTRVDISSPTAPGTFLPDGAIGEIWIKGPSIFAGYYNDPAANSECLVNGHLRTGDLGFMRNGELYVTGRIKDLLIIHGHNIMPHELEWIAEGAAGGGGSERCGAFSVAKGTEGEQAVLVLELADKSSDLSVLAHDIRSRVGRALGLPLADLVFVKRGHIPKTTSGKVQRGELRRRYLAGQIERLM